jgi:hypothetical protein
MTTSAPALPYVFTRQGRSRGALVTVAVIWLALLAARFWLDANLVVLGFVAFFTLPALWDYWRNPQSGLRLTDRAIEWSSGRRQASVAREELDYVRFDTRLDFSVRITLVLKTGRKIRLPFEATPPHRKFEELLSAEGIRCERHHFALMQ